MVCSVRTCTYNFWNKVLKYLMIVSILGVKIGVVDFTDESTLQTVFLVFSFSLYHQLSIVTRDGIQTNEKKNLNNDAVEQKRVLFTPILATCEGVLDWKVEAYIDRLPLHL